MARAPLARVRALLAHEMGHARALQEGLDWHTEKDADALGRAILGESFGYDREGVQRVGARGKRPKGLPK